MEDKKTIALYLENMQLHEFQAEICSITEDKYIQLNQTGFYPKSGGVDGDTGVLIRESDKENFKVLFTAKVNGEISHEVDHPGLKLGDKVTGIIDWNRRYELMRYHTAAHVLSGVFWNEAKVKIGGNNLVMGKGRVDFTFEDFNRQIIEDLVQKANDLIKQNLAIKTYYLSREEFEKDPDLTKLLMGIDKKIKHVRIVEIEGYDKQPDGGCHVQNLGEIGKINILKIQNKGKTNRRLYFTLDLPE